jgi:hypothetical protein
VLRTVAVFAVYFVLTWNLSLHTVWTDEQFTWDVTQLPWTEMFAALRNDIHPPLYYVLVRLLNNLSMSESLDKIRQFSTFFAFFGVILFDRLWLQNRPNRWLGLTLLATSPFLLLYARMARSYSLQLLLFVVAAHFGKQLWTEENASRRNQILFTVSLIALLYTHYVPGIALAVAWAAAMFAKRRWKPVFLIGTVSFIAYLPWLASLTEAMSKWGSRPQLTTATGDATNEFLAKIAYTLWTFALGETSPLPFFAVGIAIALAVGFWIFGAKKHAGGWPILLAGAIAFFGVVRWVTVPFVPGRLLFLLPFATFLWSRSRWSAGFILLQLVAGYCYFRGDHFLNKTYVVPLERIARLVDQPNSLVIIDSHNTDIAVLSGLIQKAQIAPIGQPLDWQRFDVVWTIRNTHDISPGGESSARDVQLGRSRRQTEWGFVKQTARDRQAMRWLGWAEQPEWFYSVKRFER